MEVLWMGCMLPYLQVPAIRSLLLRVIHAAYVGIGLDAHVACSGREAVTYSVF